MATLQEVAASLAVDNSTPATPEAPAEASTEDTYTAELETADHEGTEFDGDAELGDEEALEEVGDETPDPDGGEVGDSFTFKVEGEEVTVSADELIRSYSIDGAARKRLQEATEARARATEEGRIKGMEEAQAASQAKIAELNQLHAFSTQMLNMVGQEVLKPSVPRPDEAMKDRDPLGYTMALNEWREASEQVQQKQGQIMQVLQQQREAMEQAQVEDRKVNSMKLRQARPDLAEKQNASAFTSAVRTAQAKFGFTKDEIDAFPDYRAMLLLEYAGKAIAAEQAQGVETPAQRVVKQARTPLKPGAVTYQRTQRQKTQRKVRETARKTGSVKDVAATLIQDVPRR